MDQTPGSKAADPFEKGSNQELEAVRAQFAEVSAERDAARAEIVTLTQRLAAMETANREARHQGHIAFAEAQVSAGRVLPKDQASTIAVLDLLSETAPVEFSEGDATIKVSTVEFVKGLIERLPAAVQFGEFAPGKSGGQKPTGDAAIHAAAQRLAAEKGMSYADAVSAVVTGGR